MFWDWLSFLQYFFRKGGLSFPKILREVVVIYPKKKKKKNSGPVLHPWTFSVLSLTWGALWPLRLIVTWLDWRLLKFICAALKAHQFSSPLIGDPHFSTLTTSPTFFLVRYVWFSSLFNFLSLVCNFQFVLLNCQFKDLFSQLQSWIIMSPMYYVIIFLGIAILSYLGVSMGWLRWQRLLSGSSWVLKNHFFGLSLRPWGLCRTWPSHYVNTKFLFFNSRSVKPFKFQPSSVAV